MRVSAPWWLEDESHIKGLMWVLARSLRLSFHLFSVVWIVSRQTDVTSCFGPASFFL